MEIESGVGSERHVSSQLTSLIIRVMLLLHNLKWGMHIMTSYNINKACQATLLSLAILGLGIPAAFAVPIYNITTLKPFVVNTTGGTTINDSGQIVGNTGGNNPHAIIANASGLTVFNNLSNGSSIGTGINNNGEISGIADVNILSSTIPRAVIGDTANGLNDLGALSGQWSEGNDINNNSQVVGTATIRTNFGSNPFHAFIGDVNGLTDLGTLGGVNSYAFGVNDNGLVTGFSQYDPQDSRRHAFIGDTSGLIDMGTLRTDNSGQSYGRAINEKGQITGYSDTNTGVHAFIGDAVNGLVDIGTLDNTNYRIGSWGYGINDIGQVVGKSGLIGAGFGSRAFLWEEGVMYDLNTLIDVSDPLFGAVTLDGAWGINSFGDIIATDGLGTNFLLTAKRTLANNIPEPTPLALFGLGLLGFGLHRHKKKY